MAVQKEDMVVEKEVVEEVVDGEVMKVLVLDMAREAGMVIVVV